MTEPDPRDVAADRFVEVVAAHGTPRTKAMFGGRGVFVDDIMVVRIDRAGTASLRGDDTIADALEADGATRVGNQPYWTVPADVLADEDRLAVWVARAVTVARSHA